MLAGLTYPLYAHGLPAAALGVGNVHVAGRQADLIAVTVGISVVMVLPRLMNVLSRPDAAPSGDPFTVPANRLGSIPVDAVLLEGSIVSGAL